MTDFISGKLSARTALYAVYAMGIFFTLHMVIPVYINSTYIAELSGDQMVGIVYALGSVLTILALLGVFTLLPRVGNYRLTMMLAGLEAVAMLGLVLTSTFWIVALFFLIHFVLTTVIMFNIDIFLEHFSHDETTGGTRGLYLSLTNVGWVVAPLIAGLILTNGDYWKIYLVALILLVPFVWVLATRLRQFHDPAYDTIDLKSSLRHVLGNKDISNIFYANLILKIFFAWMVVYTPLYLHEYIGFSFKEIGFILTTMLFAYVLLEYPLGKLADKVMGEKELLILGFVVLASSTALLSLITARSVLWWATALFVTRVGAAMVEIMSETYFFKKTDSADTADLSIFRMTRPIGYIVAPAVASGLLFFFDLRWIFMVAAGVVLSGIIFAARIRDTL